MNIIKSAPLEELGYNFIEDKYIPEEFDEYYLRNIQNKRNGEYRSLTTDELQTLIRNNNISDDWSKIFVSEKFNPKLIRNCKFYGLVRIGYLEPNYKEYHDVRMAEGIYNSIIISCDIGDNVCIDNVQYLSHFIIDDDVMIANVNELSTSNHSKFGNGILKIDESEKSRIKIEVCNENGGRAIYPFNQMLPGDAYMWAIYRNDAELMQKFAEMTDRTLDDKRGYYGQIGKRTIIKNCAIIKDVWVGSDAYIKGANKIKNVTINSDENRQSQIGEGCEIVNGIIGYGCRLFYGIKAVRFVMASHSQLKYGARLINSYLGNNSTISCCEVLNTLIFPFHEQHHNNSFLCAALVMGQSNIAAGATIGSNHNSRAADGEIRAKRGFWPGLCVSLKHNSLLPSFTIIAKGDYQYELNIPIPFALVSNDLKNDELSVIPAYWFMYNKYALERNAWKSKDRDQRLERIQPLEYDYLAPDTINEIFDAIELLSALKTDDNGTATASGWENAKRPTRVHKIPQSLEAYKEAIELYAGETVINYLIDANINSIEKLKETFPTQIKREEYENIGGQVMPVSVLNRLKKSIKSGEIETWDEVHVYYNNQYSAYPLQKARHAFTSYLEIRGISLAGFDSAELDRMLERSLHIKKNYAKGVYDSRAKDYQSKFRLMMYNDFEEMEEVIGKLDDNSFIQLKFKEALEFEEKIKMLKASFQPQPVIAE